MPEDAGASEAWAAVELSRAPGVGAAGFKSLIAVHRRPSAALAAYVADGPPKPPRAKATHAASLVAARAYLDRGGTLVYLGGSGYPPPLAALSEPPPLLFVRGSLIALARPSLAVVGARAVDTEGARAAGEVARVAAAASLVVVSGGARGVDAAAHRGAIAAGTPTLVVVATGIDLVYPPEHATLFDAVVDQGGAVLTELLPGAPPSRGFFLTRNRLIAGLAAATLLVRGRAKSGALTTCRWARKLGRPCASLTTHADDPLGEAGRALAAAGLPALDGPRALAAWLARLAPPVAPGADPRSLSDRRPQ